MNVSEFLGRVLKNCCADCALHKSKSAILNIVNETLISMDLFDCTWKIPFKRLGLKQRALDIVLFCFLIGRWEQEEDEMAGWHHRLDGHEFEQAPGVGDGQGSLVCCSPWGHKESDMTERLNWEP